LLPIYVILTDKNIRVSMTCLITYVTAVKFSSSQFHKVTVRNC